MKWSRTIPLTQPLRGVRRLTGAPPQDWQEVMQTREDAAYAKGRRDGEAALNQQLVQQRAEVAELTRGILHSLQQAVPSVVEASESALIQLSLEAARKIVAGLPLNTELVEAVVREALEQVKDTTEVAVTLHASDLELLHQAQSIILEGTPEIRPLKFVTSSEMARGGCVVQTRFGIIDARRESKFERLAQSLPA